MLKIKLNKLNNQEKTEINIFGKSPCILYYNAIDIKNTCLRKTVFPTPAMMVGLLHLFTLLVSPMECLSI